MINAAVFACNTDLGIRLCKPTPLTTITNYETVADITYLFSLAVKNLGPWVEHLIHNMEDVSRVYTYVINVNEAQVCNEPMKT